MTAPEELRKLGDRKLFVDEVNTARKETYTDVTTLQQKHPELAQLHKDLEDKQKEADKLAAELAEDKKDDE